MELVLGRRTDRHFVLLHFLGLVGMKRIRRETRMLNELDILSKEE